MHRHHGRTFNCHESLTAASDDADRQGNSPDAAQGFGARPSPAMAARFAGCPAKV
jgi:hypothetical protein